jgi:tripartite-type tricarboxylate transporter receptor subunit TctC
MTDLRRCVYISARTGQAPRALSAAILSLLALTCVEQSARAETYPTSPIRVIVPTTPGGGADLLARLTARAVEETLHVSVVVENRPGAGGAVGMNAITRANPDGYMLGFVWNSVLTSLPATTAVPYTQDSYVPIIQIGYTSYVMCVAPDFPANTGSEFLEQLRRNPDKYTYGNDGIGGTMRLAAERIFAHFGIKQVAVPYKGAGETLQNFLGHQVDIYGGSIQPILPYVKNGTAKCLLLTSGADNPEVPQASGLDAVGAKGLDVGLWYGLIGPQGLPREVVDALYRAYLEAARSPAVVAALERVGAAPATHDGNEMKAMITQEYNALHEVAEHLGLAAAH